MFNENIKKLRKEKKLTQKQLAERVGISTSYLQQLELGQKENPSIDVLENLSEALGVQIDYLLGKSEYRRFASQIMQNDISHIIEKTDDTDYNFSKLSRDIVDTMFLTINDYINDKNITILKNIHDLYRKIWQIRIMVKNSVCSEILGLDLNDPDEEFETYKTEINKLLDEYYKNLKTK